MRGRPRRGRLTAGGAVGFSGGGRGDGLGGLAGLRAMVIADGHGAVPGDDAGGPGPATAGAAVAGGLLAGGALAMLPSATGGAAVALWLAVGFGAAAAVWWPLRLEGARRREVRRLAAWRALVIEQVPLLVCGWRSGRPLDQPPDLLSVGLAAALGLERRPAAADTGAAPGVVATGGLAAMAARFGPVDRDRLAAAVDRLGIDGTGFAVEVATDDAAPRVFQVTGRRLVWPGDPAPATVLWFADITALAAARDEAAAATRLFRGALDALPIPVWLREDDQRLIWCNRAYGATAEQTPAAAADEGYDIARTAAAARARATGELATDARHLVVSNERRLFAFTECPLADPAPAGPGAAPGGRLVGLAIDRTIEESHRASLARHIQAHAGVLEQLGSAIALYDADRRLLFFNQAYVRLWGFDEAWLAGKPSFGEVLEELRSRRRLPEYADYPRHKREQLDRFQTLTETEEGLLHLPDGTTLRELVVPYALGGLMFVQEDVTSTLALESSYNTLLAVQRETLDNLAEGIAVFGGDGRLKLSNPAFAAIWDLAPAALEAEPHVTAIVDQMKGFFDYGNDWSGFRGQIVEATLERASRTGRIARIDGSVIAFTNVPLPDGAVLVTFLDVTDSVRIERALTAANAALEAADALKVGLLTNVSYHLRTPLTTVIGYADLMFQEYFGALEPRQLEVVGYILESGRELEALIRDIIDLAIMEAGYLAIERVPVDVGSLLQGVLGLTREWAAQSDLAIAIECPAGTGAIIGDEKRLRQALFNLVGMAIRFPPPDQRIMLAARRRGGDVVITATIGRSPDQEAAWQSLASGAEDGTGLVTPQAAIGLALVRSLVERHNGRIDVQPDGARTLVRCILPSADPA